MAEFSLLFDFLEYSSGQTHFLCTLGTGICFCLFLPTQMYPSFHRQRIATYSTILQITNFLMFFFCGFADTYSCFILGPLIPLFWISGDISSGFQTQNGFCLIFFCGDKCNIHSLEIHLCATLANILTTSTAANCLPSCVFQHMMWCSLNESSLILSSYSADKKFLWNTHDLHAHE